MAANAGRAGRGCLFARLDRELLWLVAEALVALDAAADEEVVEVGAREAVAVE